MFDLKKEKKRKKNEEAATKMFKKRRVQPHQKNASVVADIKIKSSL